VVVALKDQLLARRYEQVNENPELVALVSQAVNPGDLKAPHVVHSASILPNTKKIVGVQEQVALILRECGFKVEIEKTIETARGTVEIDVYAEEIIKGRKYVLLCECKHWRSAVPQTIIHSFRTVVADSGANIGYIVSSNGFQSGSFKASELTNLELVTWEQFQAAFEASWIEAYLMDETIERLDPIMTYAEPFLPLWFPALPEEEQQAYLKLKEQYDEFGWIMMSFTRYAHTFRDTTYPVLPLINSIGNPAVSRIPKDILHAVSYKEFLELATNYGQAAIAQFRAIRDRNGHTGGE